MKTKLFFFSLLMGLVMVGNVQYAYAEDKGESAPPVYPIPIGLGSHLDANDLRDIVIVPLEAYYQSGTIFLDFTHNVGDVEVSVRNTTTGNSWSRTVNSADGTAQISIANGGTGSYTLTLVTAYGDCFIGNFNL